jgi:hypothetical protein
MFHARNTSLHAFSSTFWDGTHDGGVGYTTCSVRRAVRHFPRGSTVTRCESARQGGGSARGSRTCRCRLSCERSPRLPKRDPRLHLFAASMTSSPCPRSAMQQQPGDTRELGENATHTAQPTGAACVPIERCCIVQRAGEKVKFIEQCCSVQVHYLG